jgi:hypothetical protein
MPDENEIPEKRWEALYAESKQHQAAAAAAIKRAEAAEAKIAQANSRFEQAAEALEAAKASHAEALVTMQREHEIDHTLSSRGITDADAADFVRYKYQTAEAVAAEEGAEPVKPAFAEWFASYVETKPAVLRQYLEPAPTTPAPGAPKNGAVKANPAAPVVATAPAALRTAEQNTTTSGPPDIATFNAMDGASRRQVLEEMGLIEPKT